MSHPTYSHHMPDKLTSTPHHTMQTAHTLHPHRHTHSFRHSLTHSLTHAPTHTTHIYTNTVNLHSAYRASWGSVGGCPRRGVSVRASAQNQQHSLQRCLQGCLQGCLHGCLHAVSRYLHGCLHGVYTRVYTQVSRECLHGF